MIWLHLRKCHSETASGLSSPTLTLAQYTLLGFHISDQEDPFAEEFIILKMSTESKMIKLKNDLQLVVNCSNHCVWKILKKDSGAGANAGSRVDMALSATDPLSEIVWSPKRGFSLNCVDSSFDDKNASPYHDVGPSNMVFALLQGVTGGISNTETPIDDVFVNPITVICAKSGISSTGTPSSHPSDQSGVIIPDCKAHKEHHTGSGGNVEKIDAARRAPNLPNDQKENLMNYCEKNICDQANIGTDIISDTKGNKSSTISGQVEDFLPQADEPKLSMEQNLSPRELSNGGMDIGSGNQVVVTEDGLRTKVEHITEHEGSGALTSPSRSLIEKLESTAENGLQTFTCEATCAATSAALVSLSNEDRNKSEGSGMTQPCDKNLPVLHYPCNSRTHTTINESKEKSLSDGNADVSLSKEENDNHLRVESCYNAGLFLTGKKRCNFQQQLIIGSKRIKKKTQEETSYSKSTVKQDSSFMNLISNMMKGFSQSTQDLLWHDPKLITCDENQDPEPESTGFKSSFKSMSCPSLKNVGAVKSDQVGEAFKYSEQGNKEHGIDVTPINCCAGNNSLYKQCFLSNKFEVCTGTFDAVPSLQPKIRPINFLGSHENGIDNSVENKNCHHLRLSKEKIGMPLLSSPTRQDKNNNKNVGSYAPSERKVTDNFFHKSNTPGGEWMTRFLPKSTAPLITYDHLNEIGGSQVHSTDFSVLPHSHKHLSYLKETKEQSVDDHLLNEAKKLQNCCINKGASTGLKDSKGCNDHTSKHKFNPITPFPGFRDSEPMASMFARRLGAIKHMQTDRTDGIQHRKTSSSGGAPSQKLVLSLQPEKI